MPTTRRGGTTTRKRTTTHKRTKGSKLTPATRRRMSLAAKATWRKRKRTGKA